MANRPNGTLYTGVTSNIARRAYEHREGLVKGFTKRYGLKRLVYTEFYESTTDAIQRESNMKHWPRLASADQEGVGMDILTTAIRFDDSSMWVELSDGRTIGVPFAWFPRLLYATHEQREPVEVGCMGLHWEDLDEDISVAGLLAGRGDRTRWGRQERKRIETAPSKSSGAGRRSA